MAIREAGKGDRYRPVDQKKWAEGWERAFGIRLNPAQKLILRDIQEKQKKILAKQTEL